MTKHDISTCVKCQTPIVDWDDAAPVGQRRDGSIAMGHKNCRRAKSVAATQKQAAKTP